MKRLALLLLSFLIITLSVSAQKSDSTKVKDSVQTEAVDSAAVAAPQKQVKDDFTVHGTIHAWQLLLQTLQSPKKALHSDVEDLEEWITEQVQAQLPKQEAPKKTAKPKKR